MSEFTREEKEKIVESARFCMHNSSCEHCPLGDGSCNKKNELLISLYEKYEKEEPAPSETDTSSKENIVYKDDSTALKKSQERLKTKLELIALQTNVQLFEDIEEYQVSIPMLSHMIGEVHGIVSDILIDLEAGEQDG